MPAKRRYDLGELWRWMQCRPGVTAREIAEHLGCDPRYVRRRILPDMERLGYRLDQFSLPCGERGPKPAVYEPFDNMREK